MKVMDFRSPVYAVKAVDNSGGVNVEGILVPFGSRVERDLYGEFFTSSTDIKENWYNDRPLLYSHGRAWDGAPGAEAVGYIKELTKTELGWWAKGELLKSSQYFEYISMLVRDGMLYFSSGALPSMVEVSRDGEIKQWPVIEGSLTPTPAEPRRTNVAMVKSIMLDLKIPFIDFENKDIQGEEKMPTEKEKDQINNNEGEEEGKSIKKKLELDLDLKVNLINPNGDALKEANEKDAQKVAEGDEEAKKIAAKEGNNDDDDEEEDEEEDKKEAGDQSKSKSKKSASELDRVKDSSYIKKFGKQLDTVTIDGKEMECWAYDDEIYCYQIDGWGEETKSKKDSKENSETNERITIMDVQLKQFIVAGAKEAGFTVNDEGVKAIEPKMIAYSEGITGSKTLTMGELKLLLKDPDFIAKAKEWFKEHSENGEVDEMASAFGTPTEKEGEKEKAGAKEADGDKDESDDKNKDKVGANGKSKSKAADANSFAGKNFSFTADFKERHKFDNLSPAEKSFYAHKMNDLYLAKHKRPWAPTNGFLESLEDGSKDFVDKYHYHMAIGNDELGRVAGDVPIAVKALEHIRERKTSHRSVKDNELNFSTQADFGDEWVPDLWQGELWGLMISEAVVAGLISVTPMASNPYNIPLEGDDPEIYTAPETKHDSDLTNTGPIPSSKIPTAKTLIYAHKLGIRSNLSHEYEEDAIIAVIPNMLKKQRRAMYNGIDNVLLNAFHGGSGAATATDNPSHYGYAPGAKNKLLLGIERGMMAQTIFEDGNVLSANHGLPKLELWRKAQGMMHEEYIAEEGDMVWLCSPRVRHVIQSTDKFLDAEIHSGKITGKFGDIQSIPITTTFQLKDGDAQGRINVNADGSLDTVKNDRGRALLLYRPYWTLGYRRRLQTWSLYDPVYDAYQAGAWIRIGMIRRDDERRTSIAMTDIRI